MKLPFASKIPASEVHEAPSEPIHERLKALNDFVGRFVPAIGERREGPNLADDDATPAVLIARDDALVAALEAVERLVRQL